jgi:hypothetical protein
MSLFDKRSTRVGGIDQSKERYHASQIVRLTAQFGATRTSRLIPRKRYEFPTHLGCVIKGWVVEVCRGLMST